MSPLIVAADFSFRSANLFEILVVAAVVLTLAYLAREVSLWRDAGAWRVALDGGPSPTLGHSGQQTSTAAQLRAELAAELIREARARVRACFALLVVLSASAVAMLALAAALAVFSPGATRIDELVSLAGGITSSLLLGFLRKIWRQATDDLKHFVQVVA